MSSLNASGDAADRIAAQNDLSLPGSNSDVEQILSAVEEGRITQAQLDACCENILRVVAKSNTFNEWNGGALDAEGGASIAKEAASEGMVLLKNDNGALPAAGEKAAIFGNAQIYTRIGGTGDGVNAVSYTHLYACPGKMRRVLPASAKPAAQKKAPAGFGRSRWAG